MPTHKFLDNSKHAPQMCGTDACDFSGVRPRGITRAGDIGLAQTRLLPEHSTQKFTPQNPATIAVFDFDGTCINGSSPMRLVNVLIRHGKLNPYKMLRLTMWGVAYKLNLPKDAEAVRKRVFSAFAGQSELRVNHFLCRFYHAHVESHWRKDADACMQAHLDLGHAVVLVSATFEPIVAAAMVDHPIQYAVASRMKIDASGNYTNQTEGITTEGPDKTKALKAFADKIFGEGCWKIGFAYADHFSDVDILQMAKCPVAVTPDSKLERYAKKQNWQIEAWQ